MSLEKVLLNEKDSPTERRELPEPPRCCQGRLLMGLGAVSYPAAAKSDAENPPSHGVLGVGGPQLSFKSDESDASGDFSFFLIWSCSSLREKRVERIVTFVTATTNTTHVARGRTGLPERILSTQSLGKIVHIRQFALPNDSAWVALMALCHTDSPPSKQTSTDPPMALKSMSIAKLQDLKAKVDAAISEKVSSRREELEAEMSKLEGYTGGARRGRPPGRGGPRGTVAPKYRNPENPSETWAGRGLRPRWLVAAIKGGKKLEDFAIGGAAKGSPAKKGRKKRTG
jgi:DNA-binding protein H-NS